MKYIKKIKNMSWIINGVYISDDDYISRTT